MTPGSYLLDILDIALVAWVFYRLLLVFRQTRAIRVLVGMGGLVVLYGVARLLEFEGVLGMVDHLRGNRLEVAVVILVVIFADELKDAFGGMFWRLPETRASGDAERVVEEVGAACASMASRSVGALLAITRTNPLDRWILADSVPVDAPVTAQMLETIFTGKTPLHDGAVIIRDGRIAAAKCQFPPSDDPKITKLAVGMRHRAAFGLSEMSDAVVVVVSEERGKISVMHRGERHSPVEPKDLVGLLRQLLEIEAADGQQIAFWHPRRALAHGRLKALAACLAVVLWADQEPPLRLRDRIVVFEHGTREVRRVALTAGRDVIADPGFTLEAARDGTYIQTRPDVDLVVRASNFQRVRLLPTLMGHWLRGRSATPAEVVGQFGIEFPVPTQANGAPHGGPLGGVVPCRVVLAGDGVFALDEQVIDVTIDRLAPLEIDPAAERGITVAWSGTPAKGYSVLDPNPTRVSLAGENHLRDLVVPSALRPRVVAFLDPCPTDPPISVEGAGADAFSLEVALTVPADLSRWNPGREFRARVVLELIREEDRLAAQQQQLSEEQRAILEALRAEANGRATEARDRFAQLERKLLDGSWELGYRLASFDTLVEQTMPDLRSRVEKARVELEVIGQTLARLEGTRPGSRRERALLRIRQTAGLKEQELRREIHDARRSHLALLEKEASTVAERVRPLLDAVERATRAREQVRAAQLPLPPVETDADLAALIERDGPVGAARTAGMTPIARAAGAQATVQLYARAAAVFERRADASRETRALDAEIVALQAQIDGRLPATLTPFRLDLVLREKEILREMWLEVTEQQKRSWAELLPRLRQAAVTFDRETELLAHVAERWPAAAVGPLEVEPVLALHREVHDAGAATLPTERILDEQARRADPALSTDARAALVAWREHRAAMRRRLAILTRIARRIVVGDAVPADQAFDIAAAEAELERIARAVAEADARLVAYASGERPIELDDLTLLEQELAGPSSDLEQARAKGARLREALQRAEERLAAATPGARLPPELRPVAFEVARLRAQLTDHGERERRLETLLGRLQELIAFVRPVLDRLLTTLRARTSELDQQGAAPLPEHDAALAFLGATRRERQAALVGLETALASRPSRLTDEVVSAHLLAAVAAPPPTDPALGHLIGIRARIESVTAQIATLGEAPSGPAATGDRSAAAEAELRRRLRAHELRMRQGRLERLQLVETALRSHLDDDQAIGAVSRVTSKLDEPAAAALPLEALRGAQARWTAEITRSETEVAALSEPGGDEAESERRERRASAIRSRIATARQLVAALDALVARIEELRGGGG